jgi:hypothetical protein
MSSLNLPNQPRLEPFNVLAFDPGGTTGWALASYFGAINPVLEDIKISTGEFGPSLHYKELYELVSSQGFCPSQEIVFEPFHYRQNVVEDGAKFLGKVELISAEYIGVIKLACWQHRLKYYDKFTPGEAKRYVPNRKLELLGWLQTPITAMRHRNDALRQLVKYLIVKRGVRHPLTTAWRLEE